MEENKSKNNNFLIFSLILNVILFIVIIAILIIFISNNKEVSKDNNPIIIDTITPTVNNDNNVNWDNVIINDYGISLKIPKEYTYKFEDQKWFIEYNNVVDYQDLKIYNGDRLILSTFLNQNGGNPMQCQLLDSNMKPCEVVYSINIDGKKWELLADTNGFNPPYQFLDYIFNCGDSGKLCVEGSIKPQMLLRVSNYYDTKDSSDLIHYDSLTLEEFTNAVLIINSLKEID